MAEPSPHGEAYLVVGMLSGFPDLFGRAARALSARFGEVARESGILPFDFTDYYAQQMGEAIKRKFIALEKPFDPEQLVATKLWTNDLEAQFAGVEFPVPRPINLDPGYVTLSKLVLATTKDQAHRIYLSRGIYAEVTLAFVQKEFQQLKWTYPDYRTKAYRRFFEAVRMDLLERTANQNSRPMS